jgi:hypothetical protein
MSDTPAPPAADQELLLSLQLTLRLQRTGPQARWSAQLSAPGQAMQLNFATLPALIGYIARLESPGAGSGLR